MKKLVDPEVQEPKVIESKPLEKGEPTAKPVTPTKSNNTGLIIGIVLLIMMIVGFMIWNHVQNARKNG